MQDEVTLDALYRQLVKSQKYEGGITSDMVKQLVIAAGGNGKSIKIAQLVRYVMV